MSRKVVINCRRMREQLRFFGALVNWMGFSTGAIEVAHASSLNSKSTYTLGKLWKLAADTVIAYSDKPLRLAIRFGFLTALLAFVYGIYILLKYFFFGSPVQGWSSLIASLYFIGGIIISILGIIGIYLGKTFDEAKKRPLYIVADSTFPENAERHYDT
jgi:dolichol-phosphate mannosyltransferase